MTIARDKANSTVTNFASTGIDDNASSTAVTIDSSGTIMTGKTVENTATDGIELNRNNVLVATRNNDAPLLLNRRSSDAEIAVFRKDNTTVGNIGTNSGGTYFAGNGSSLLSIGDAVLPRSTTGGSRNGIVDLGNAANQFEDLYLSGGVYLGGTGSANKLDDYEEGTWTPTITGITSASEIKSGWYYKIGGIVTVQCVISLPSASKTSSDVQISGFPFTASQSVCGNYHFVNSYQNHFADPQTNGSFSKYLNHTYTTSMQKYDGTQLIGTDVAGSSPELYLYVVYPT